MFFCLIYATDFELYDSIHHTFHALFGARSFVVVLAFFGRKSYDKRESGGLLDNAQCIQTQVGNEVENLSSIALIFVCESL